MREKLTIIILAFLFYSFSSCTNEGKFKSLGNQKAPWLMVDTSTSKICISTTLKSLDDDRESEIYSALNWELGETKYCDGSPAPKVKENPVPKDIDIEAQIKELEKSEN